MQNSIRPSIPDVNYFLSFDEVSFKMEPSSKFPHSKVNALGSYRQSPFVTGSCWGKVRNGFRTEILNYKDGHWNQAADHPSHSNIKEICGYATTHTEESVFIIGGSNSKILQYKDDIWTIVGSIQP